MLQAALGCSKHEEGGGHGLKRWGQGLRRCPPVGWQPGVAFAHSDPARSTTALYQGLLWVLFLDCVPERSIVVLCCPPPRTRAAQAALTLQGLPNGPAAPEPRKETLP